MFKSFRKSINPENTRNFALSQDFKYTFLNELSKLKQEFHRNLTTSDFKNLSKFLKNRPFYILPCDKNVGTIFMNSVYHEKLCLDHLTDEKVYLKLNNNPLIKTFTKINQTLKYLKKIN